MIKSFNQYMYLDVNLNFAYLRLLDTFAAKTFEKQNPLADMGKKPKPPSALASRSRRSGIWEPALALRFFKDSLATELLGETCKEGV